jgi:DNA primase
LSQVGDYFALRKFGIASKAKRGKNNQARMGTIPSETIEQIAAANDIVEVIGSYFPLKRAGANFKALCPFHQEKTPSFIVSPSRQTFHCFGCGAGGSVFRFVMDYEHIDFPAAVHKLGARAGITVVEKSRTSGADDEERQGELRRRLLKLHAEAAQWFHENLIKREVGEAARKYLKQRGITLEIANRWQLGYAPNEWDAFGSWARARGYDVRDLIASGLVKMKDDAEGAPSETAKAYDRFRGRIMFPIHDHRTDEVIAFSGRLLKDEEGAAKYLNSPETALFRKGSVLFGLNKTKRALIEANCAVVCEGQLDLISLFESGITNVVAPQGTAFTDGQARILKRFVEEVVLCFDSDAAGTKAAERSLDPLLQNDLIVRVAEMPAGEDPDSLVRLEGIEKFQKRIAAARDFFDYWIDHEIAGTNLQPIAAKKDVARKIVELIRRMPDPLTRGQAAQRLAVRLGLPIPEVTSLLPGYSARRIDIAGTPSSWGTLPQAIEQLCRLAIRNPEFLEFLRSQDWRDVIFQTEGAEMLGRVIENFKLESIDSFLGLLTQEERVFVADCLVRKRVPSNERDFGFQWWTSLRTDLIRRKKRATEALLTQPQLSTGEEVNLQKQILDLQEQLHELSQPAGRGDN